MGCNLIINGIYWGYNPLTNHLLSSCDIQATVDVSSETAETETRRSRPASQGDKGPIINAWIARIHGYPPHAESTQRNEAPKKPALLRDNGC